MLITFKVCVMYNLIVVEIYSFVAVELCTVEVNA